MPSGLFLEIRALETMEKVIASLRRDEERDAAIEGVIRDMEGARAALLERVMSTRRA